MALCNVLSLLILNVFDLYIVIEYVRTRFSSRIWITLASVYQTYNRFVKSSQWAPRWTSTCQYWRKRVGQVNAVKLYAFLQSSAPWCTLKAKCSANSCAVVLMTDVRSSLISIHKKGWCSWLACHKRELVIFWLYWKSPPNSKSA